MSEESQQNIIVTKRVVYEVPGLDTISVLKNVEYAATEHGSLKMDVYSPPDAEDGGRRPAVVFVTGYSDPGAEEMLGRKLKEWRALVSWAQLVASSGMVGITYENQDPVADAQAVLRYIRQNAASLRVDEERIGVWASSGNVPNALGALIREENRELRCAVLCYGFTFDEEGSTGVVDAAAQWGFANPCVGKSVDDLPPDLPLFVARAGRDECAGLNDAMDRFVADALARNLPVTIVNHAAGPHAFDLFDDSETTRQIIRSALSFLRFHLAV